METLVHAERFIESQGFHLMRREDIPKFARCATESYGSISYALDDYFVGHPRTKEELWEMWIFNLKYFYSRMPGFFGCHPAARVFQRLISSAMEA